MDFVDYTMAFFFNVLHRYSIYKNCCNFFCSINCWRSRSRFAFNAFKFSSRIRKSSSNFFWCSFLSLSAWRSRCSISNLQTSSKINNPYRKCSYKVLTYRCRSSRALFSSFSTARLTNRTASLCRYLRSVTSRKSWTHVAWQFALRSFSMKWFRSEVSRDFRVCCTHGGGGWCKRRLFDVPLEPRGDKANIMLFLFLFLVILYVNDCNGLLAFICLKIVMILSIWQTYIFSVLPWILPLYM